GYFAQNQSEYLDKERTVLQIMEDAATDSNRVKVRDMLGAFLFGGDDVDKKAKVLSGGERNRLALCKLLLQPINTLIMDEPTNHLDMASKNVLKKALNDFEGTLIVVSHDRDFLQGLTSTVYGFKDKVIKEYLGDIDYFLEQHKMENLREAEKRTKVVVEKKKPNSNAKQDRKSDKEKKKLQNRLSKIEAEISSLERTIINLDAQISDDFEAVSSDPEFYNKYQEKKNTLDELMEQWSELDDLVNA
ncbi:MAG: ABC-F family ATP-binding cassette domain-containing protein, partial [Flavobacteriaceae bacterium]|nr:ABC-F family ATP-binding cassette domain-containing protein [Flavobacteriaceae bacterium]